MIGIAKLCQTRMMLAIPQQAGYTDNNVNCLGEAER
jgi:hypothetical protein